MARLGSVVALGCALLFTTGCATLDSLGQAVAPSHPVTGQPVLNYIPESQEIATAQAAWEQLQQGARRDRIPLDPPGPRLNQIQSVFGRLVAVAHRQQLPWQVHLIGHPMVNAMTPGGGMVWVFDGLFGGMVPPWDDHALAAVLAHEIAHVTLLHVPMRTSWSMLGQLASDRVGDQFYQAAYSTDQEAEADKLGVLYMALAGFDPGAASRVWLEAHRKHGSSAARRGFLHDHPLDAERMAATQAVAQQVAPYWVPQRRNPKWEEILANNPLFPRAADVGTEPGSGVPRLGLAALDAYVRHEETKQDQRARKRNAEAFSQIQIVRAWEAPTNDGYIGIFLEVYNGSGRSIDGLVIGMHGLHGTSLVATDDSCRLAVALPPGSTQTVGCYKPEIPGATRIAPAVLDARFR